MTTEFLGTQTMTVQRPDEPPTRVDVPVYVVWCDFQDRALVAQVVLPAPCPRCEFPLNIGPLFSDPGYASISVTCANCHAVTHFDRTPKADRPNLRWIRGFKKD